MASVIPVLLLCLFLQCVPTYTRELCMLRSDTNGSQFSLMVTPEYYKPSTTYYVNISGSASEVTVALSASYNGTAIGEWSNGSPDCSGVEGERNLTFTEKWTSPAGMNNTNIKVVLRAYVQYSANQTSLMEKIIKQAPAPTSAPPTDSNMTYTSMPATGNMTYTSMPAAGNMTYTSMPATGNMTYTSMPATGNMTYTSMLATGNMTYTSMPATGNMTYTSMPTTGNMTYTNMTTTSPNMSPTVEAVKTTAGAITFKPLGGFASMLLLFVTVQELLL